MMKKYYLLLILALFLTGCPSPKPITKEVPPPSPKEVKVPVLEIVVHFASIDLSQYTQRIEKSDIQKFASQLKKDSIDILTIQSITRYPELKSRVDLVDELAGAADMRKAFGETINISGRQNGNGIFAVYPIRSSDNLQFDKLKSTGFEAALQTIIDCGSRDILIVSTQISDKATETDISNILTTLGHLTKTYPDHPIIISGNLSPNEAGNKMTAYENVTTGKIVETPTVWFSKNESVRMLEHKTVSTVFGKMVLVNFGIYRQPM